MNAEPHRPRILLAVMLVAAVSCAGGPPPKPVEVASTTSIVDTGLADALAERFLDATRIRMRIRAVGSGEAFALGRRGDVDLVLAHDPGALAAFERDGFADRSRPFARNDFVLAGPPADPARVRGEPTLADAFRRIATAKVPFVSRGDRSGTHARELVIWSRAGVPHDGDWYVATGQGMAETLQVASERGAYVLTDSATLAVSRSGLTLLVARGPGRENVYVAVVVRFGGRAAGTARRFLSFLAQPVTKAAIASFGGERYGRPLFEAP